MGDFGFKLSKPGFDVKTADLKDQIINSSANSLKIWMTGSVNISVSAYNAGTGTGGEGSTNIAHNLGYEPFFLCYFKLKDANKLWMQNSLDETQLASNYFINCEAYADSTNLTMRVFLNGDTDLAAWTAVGYYIIFIDKSYE